MNTRTLLAQSVLLLCALMACLVAFCLVVVRALLTELADEVKASRNEQRNRISGGNMCAATRNRKVSDLPSTTLLRAMNADLAAKHGDATRVIEHVDLAQFYAGNAAMIRRSL